MTWSDPIVRYQLLPAVYLATWAVGEALNVGTLGTLRHAGARSLSHTVAGTDQVAGYTGRATSS